MSYLFPFSWRLVIVLLLLAVLVVAPTLAQEDVYFPTTEWRTSTPEEQGMDSAALADLIEGLPNLADLDSLLIVRNGYVVAEVYWHPFQSGLKHEMMSASKSVISALVGIAIDKGYIQSVNQKVLDFFPELELKNLDNNKRAMTIRDLLTMTSGFGCDIASGGDPIIGRKLGIAGGLFLTDTNATQDSLDWRMAGKPGTTWRYCQINVYLLSKILTTSTGMDTLAFARQYLFEPLGITDVNWNISAEGIALGYMGLMLNTRDMAKIGYLFLHNGRWENSQVISAEWVQESVQDYSPQNPWGSLVAGYGYLWWPYQTPSGDFFEANGAYSQHIRVSPEKNLVVADTGTDSGDAFYLANFYDPTFMKAILNAVKSDEPLPRNPEGVARLESAVQAAANPEAHAAEVLPPLASQISGKTYDLTTPNLLLAEGDVLRLPEEVWQMATLGLDFEQDSAVLRLETESGIDLNLPVGLDGVYRITTNELGTTAALGEWATETQFVLHLRRLEQGPVLEYTLNFAEDAFSGTVVSDRPGDGFAPNPATLVGEMMP